MDLITPSWVFKLFVLSAIVILLLATAIVLAKKDVSLFKRVFLLLLTWLLPIFGRNFGSFDFSFVFKKINKFYKINGRIPLA